MKTTPETNKKLPLISHKTNKQQQQQQKYLKSTKVKKKNISIKKSTTDLVNVKNKCVHDVKNINEKKQILTNYIHVK